VDICVNWCSPIKTTTTTARPQRIKQHKSNLISVRRI
jgi:hypothetical protein